MKGLMDFFLFFICLESSILELGADPSHYRGPLEVHDQDTNSDKEKRIGFNLIEFTTTSTTSTVTTSVDKSKDKSPPSIKLSTNSSLITSAGQTVYLHCQVENLGDRQVSWIRRSDLKILTIGQIVYTNDNRFSCIYDNISNVWILKLSQAQVEDSGDYECQISYHDDVEKKLKLPFSLTVLDSRAYIHDSPDLYVQRGSKLQLTCYVRDSSNLPDYVYWYQNRDVLNYSPLVTIEDLRKPEDAGPQDNDIIVSRLSIVGVTRTNSGNYTCAPSNARPKSINVHVVDDESGPAAMQHGTGSPRVSKSHLVSVIWSFIISLSVNKARAFRL